MGTLGYINDMMRRDKENRELRKLNRDRIKNINKCLVFIVLDFISMFFCYTKVRIKSDKQKNVAKLLADRRFRKMA